MIDLALSRWDVYWSRAPLVRASFCNLSLIFFDVEIQKKLQQRTREKNLLGEDTADRERGDSDTR